MISPQITTYGVSVLSHPPLPFLVVRFLLVFLWSNVYTQHRCVQPRNKECRRSPPALSASPAKPSGFRCLASALRIRPLCPDPMRLFSKFHAVCALAVCSILLSASFLASQHYYRRVVLTKEPSSDFRAPASFDRRLVVFGDSWSDNNAAELQGSVWTDWLCNSVSVKATWLDQSGKLISRPSSHVTMKT